MSKVFDLDIEGKAEKAVPRDIAYDPVSDEPIHIDFMRIVKGSRLILEIPVKFINFRKVTWIKKRRSFKYSKKKSRIKVPYRKYSQRNNC